MPTTLRALRRVGRLRWARRAPSDAGVGLVAVIGSFTLVMVVLLGTLAYVAASVRFARWEQDSTAAEAAAQSGIHDFLTWLRLEPLYLDVADPARTGAQDYCGNPAAAGPDVLLPVDPGGSPVCTNWDASTPVGWAAVEPGATASRDTPSYHYRLVENDPVARSLVLEVVGRSKDVYRTVQARIGFPAPSDYVYFSDYELADPDDETAYPDNPHYTGSQDTSAECGGGGVGSPMLRYAWDTTAGTGRTYIPATGGAQLADCREPLFAGMPKDKRTITGPVHSNDTIRAESGQVFQGPFSTSNPACTGLDPNAGSTAWATACLNGPALRAAEFSEMPEYVAPLDLPGNLDELRVLAESGTGCRYEGATHIEADANGTMTVWSPGTTDAAQAIPCGEPKALASPEGATVPIPADGLVYVADSADASLSREVYGEELGGSDPSLRFPLGGFTGAPAAPGATYISDLTMRDTIKQARYGNLYLEGVVQGQVTFVAAQSVVLLSDILLADGLAGTDVVGLVAGRSVEIAVVRQVTWSGRSSTSGEVYWHQGAEVANLGWPGRLPDPGTGTFQPFPGLRVQAAILALGGSFRLQHWSEDVSGSVTDRGELLVEGSIAQRFRGVIGMDAPGAPGTDRATPVTGYAKTYTYDERLSRGLRPPYFPSFTATTWSVLWTEEHVTDPAVKAP